MKYIYDTFLVSSFHQFWQNLYNNLTIIYLTLPKLSLQSQPHQWLSSTTLEQFSNQKYPKLRKWKYGQKESAHAFNFKAHDKVSKNCFWILQLTSFSLSYSSSCQPPDDLKTSSSLLFCPFSSCHLYSSIAPELHQTEISLLPLPRAMVPMGATS